MRWSSLCRLLLVCLPAVAGCDDRESDTPARSGVRSASGLEQVETLAWKADLQAHRPLFSAGGQLWVARQTSLVPVDDDTGEPEQPLKLPDSPTSSFSLSGGRAYFGAGKSLHAVSIPKVENLWDASTAGTIGTSPTIVGDTVVVAASKLHALEIDSGEERWVFSSDGDFYGSPAAIGGRAYVGDSNGEVYAVDVDTGQPVWEFETGDSFGAVSAAASKEMVVIPGRRGVVWGIFAESGRERWRFRTGGVTSVGAALSGETAWVGTEFGEVVAINVLTGQEMWRVSELAAVTTRPVVAGGMVHVGSDDGKLVAIDRDTGEIRWDFALDAEPLGPPLIGSRELFVADVRGNVYALR